ncbi:MAG: polyprenyl synthetase family protein [Proteobacteria bacterium]|nr:polyprenyl synthetase family protein [Pseudomonadota bacterium]NDC23314.1 polyprenyl synthetase family protein [Pseudomonadota bacterium]NDD03443.1 polyprenyl synthetase family protein [Pseudomonadota bacterium]NDG26144.1 polyprenyl synthetase family protein [Pseudomonadota bacterium]
MNFQSYSASRVALIEAAIGESLVQYQKTASLRFAPLVEAMSYSLSGGGKRFRPLLTLASAECLGFQAEDVLPAALAVEYIHTYSLIHDDLPALDDDDTRRGKPSNHKKFGEAVAILTGDALLTEAFGQLARLQESTLFSPKHILSAFELLVSAAGVRGLVGGQFIDVTLEQTQFNLPEVEFIHIHKTGAMIVASVLLPARLCGLEEKKSALLKRYGAALGLAFQISDDILDAESSNRYSRGPRKKARPAYSELMNRAEMQDLLNNLIDTANTCAQALGDKSSHLVDIAEFIRNRKH